VIDIQLLIKKMTLIQIIKSVGKYSCIIIHALDPQKCISEQKEKGLR